MLKKDPVNAKLTNTSESFKSLFLSLMIRFYTTYMWRVNYKIAGCITSIHPEIDVFLMSKGFFNMKYIAATVLLATMAFGASVTPTPKPTQMPTPSPVDPSQSITVWADQSVDMLYCVSDECGGDGHGEPDYLSICYEDIPCRNLLQCANQCPINSEEHTKCVAANCKAPILAATNRLNSLGKFYNLTSCMIKNCPRDEDAILRREKQEIKQDNECLNATVPLLAEMNHDTVTA
eukprot:jgi/Bigna1/147371/aug1.144_g22079